MEPVKGGSGKYDVSRCPVTSAPLNTHTTGELDMLTSEVFFLKEEGMEQYVKILT